jgi:(p)ppGpp synthase/HD superfamily hydrolase
MPEYKRVPGFEVSEASERLAGALAFATLAHARAQPGGDIPQVRKGTDIPYVSHLLQVAGLVLDHGGNLELAIAALLHDAIEDGRDVTRERLAERFGAAVARIVADCSDAVAAPAGEKKPPWRERKQRYIDHLRGAPAGSAVVSACDKLQNLAAMIADVQRDGVKSMDRFNAPPADQLWFYREVLAAVADRVPASLRLQYERHLAEFAALVRT